MAKVEIFKGKKILNNRISAHATRLITNCIVAYNGIILNANHEEMIKNGAKENELQEFYRISPIAWGHLLFTGRYSFMKSDGKIDIALFVKKLAEIFWQGKAKTSIKEGSDEIVATV